MTTTTKKPANRLETISCFKCQKQLENITERVANQPDGALEFISYGHYGSRAFDPMNGDFLIINICDDCLLEASEKGLVAHPNPSRTKIKRIKLNR